MKFSAVHHLLLSSFCYLNRNLRYGNSKSRLFRFLVIRIRSYLKKYIELHIDEISHFREKTIKLKYAGKLKLSPNDFIDRWLYTGADFEPHIVRLFIKILRKGDAFLDLGANIGYFSMIASNQIGEDGYVYSFEPNPQTLAKLKRNITLNKKRNLIVYDKAVSDQQGEIYFNIPIATIKNSGRASIRPIEESYSSIKVQTVVLDELINEFKPLRLIKMDIEGAEALALHGMINIIERDRPFLIMELSDAYLKQLGSSADAVIAFLKKLSYTIYIAGEEIEAIDNTVALNNHQYDIFCIPQKHRQEGEDIIASIFCD